MKDSMPITGVKNVNGTLTGTGFMFDFVDLFARHLHFTYEIALPKENIIGNTTHGMLSLLYTKVIYIILIINFAPILFKINN